MGLEGHIEIGLTRSGGRITAAAVRSRRPQVAGRLLAGQDAGAALARIPLVFSVCARAQGAAAAAALDAAAGREPDVVAQALTRRRVLAESLHEALWRVLCDWPDLLGEAREPAPLMAMRRLLQPLLKDGGGDAGETASACLDLLADAAFGEPLAEWTARLADGALEAWWRRGATPAARFVAAAVGADAARQRPASPLRCLPVLSAVECSAAFAGLLPGDDFAALPQWQGAAAETGPAGRMHALLAPLAAAHGDGLLLRLVARLLDATELARRLGRAEADGDTVIDAARGADGCGWGVVETARGMLMHVARLEGATIVGYGIVAPTEWNFHPDGALAGLVVGSPAPDRAAAESIAALAVQALDPCVAHRVEVVDA